jgi:hypothetical protein
MPLEQTGEEPIERWMLTVATDGGIDRFDDLHIDKIDARWKDPKVWVRAGLEAYRTAVALRNRHQLPFVVALGFSLKSSEKLLGMECHTIDEFSNWLDWSPPSLYLFRPGKTPSAEAQRGVVEKILEENVMIQDLNPAIFGADVSVERAYCMVFRSTGSNENTSSVFVEG